MASKKKSVAAPKLDGPPHAEHEARMRALGAFPPGAVVTRRGQRDNLLLAIVVGHIFDWDGVAVRVVAARGNEADAFHPDDLRTVEVTESLREDLVRLMGVR